MFLLSNIILMRGVRTSGMVNNLTINTKGRKRGLDILESFTNMMNIQ